MTDLHHGALYATLLTEGHKIIRRHYAADCCIAATRITCDVLQHFGIEASPVPTKIVVQNPKLAARTIRERGVQLPLRPGEYSVGIGYGLPTHKQGRIGYNGHLVTFTKEFLIDLTIDQANRPQHNINLHPVIERAALPTVIQINGCLIQYKASDDYTFTEASDWHLCREEREECVRQIIAKIERVMKPAKPRQAKNFVQ
jgi:hypothetical protein